MSYFMTTLRDYLLEGGIKGRRFVHPNYLEKGNSVVYEITTITMKNPNIIVIGSFVDPQIPAHHEYVGNLRKCLEHKEYVES